MCDRSVRSHRYVDRGLHAEVMVEGEERIFGLFGQRLELAELRGFRSRHLRARG
jgi:hypothetical protein